MDEETTVDVGDGEGFFDLDPPPKATSQRLGSREGSNERVFPLPPRSFRFELTLFATLFVSIHSALLGFKSFPKTKHLFLAAGTAKGPTPAKTSAMS